MRRTCAVIGVLFAFAVVVGGELYRENSLSGLVSSPMHVLGQLALALVAGLAAAAFTCACIVAQRRLSQRGAKPAWAFFTTWRGALVVWVVMFALWLPCLFAYWPGSFAYDIPTQTDYIASGHWTTQQPPLHTLIWAVLLNLEGFLSLRAITWYALFQMAFLSAAFACVLTFLARRGTSRVLWTCALVFFALNPVMALFSITPVKDVLLAGALCLLSIGVVQLVSDPDAFFGSKARCAGFGACLVMCCLLRTNMLVAVVLFAIAFIAVCRKRRLATAVLLGAPLLVTLAIVGPGYSAAGITAGSSAIASVPFQQVVNVVRNHEAELSEEELAIVDAVIPVDTAIERYNPRFADSVVRLFKGKTTGVSAMRDEIADFAQLWISFIGRYPLDCFDAFLSLNVPYWYPFASTPDPYSQRAYIETEVWKATDNYEIELDSLAPALHSVYERVADYSALNNPVCGLLFSPSSVIWVLLVCTGMLYCSGSRRRALLCLLPLVFWLSFMIGPVSNMRYVFPLFSLYPLLMCAALQPTSIFSKGRPW